MSEYIITDGSRFIYRNHLGKYVPTPSEAMADVCNLNAAHGYKTYKMVKERKIKRRSIKSQLPIP